MSVFNNEFKVHKLNSLGIETAQGIAIMFDVLLQQLTPICGPSREFSIVKTKLEEACFFAKKAMAIKPEHQINDD